MKFAFDWDWPGAEAEYKRAIELNPNYATAHHWYADFLGVMGRHDEARTEIDKALELDPLSLIINGESGRLYQWAGLYDDALKQEQKTLEMDPGFIPTHYWLFQWYLRQGRSDEAFTHFMGHFPAYHNMTTAEKDTLQNRYQNSNWNGVARFMINKLEVKSREKYVAPSKLSVYYVMLNDHARALDYLEKAYQVRAAQMVYIGLEAEFDALRKEPRFQELLKKVGLEE
ncbi:MAG: tetratricopeptide repeat protein [bacterium]